MTKYDWGGNRPNHIWSNALPANIRKWDFHEIKLNKMWRNYKFAWNSCTIDELICIPREASEKVSSDLEQRLQASDSEKVNQQKEIEKLKQVHQEKQQVGSGIVWSGYTPTMIGLKNFEVYVKQAEHGQFPQWL